MANKIIITDPELSKLIGWFDTSIDALREGRDRAMRDRDFYDGNQWSDSDISELEKRGQPVVVFNHIAPKIDYILGEQITARVDPAAWPVTSTHEEGADALTAAMRSVTDRNDSDIYESEVFEDFLIEGAGAMLVSEEIKSYGDNKEICITLTPVPWDRFAWDHRSRRRDFRDAQWLAVVAWYDIEDAKAEYPNNDELLDAAIESGQPGSDNHFDDWPEWWAEKDTKRIRVCQMFYRKGGEWHEAHFTKTELGFLIKPRKVKLVDDNGKTQCPLIAASPYVARRRSDKAPERYGVVRRLISPQEEINKRRSKAMHFLNVNQIIAEQTALLMSKDQALEELAKPDGYVEVAPGALREGKIQINKNLELAQSQFQLLQEAKAEIDTVGPQAPLIGSDDRVQTGRSLQVRGEAGDKQLKPAFDSLRFFQRRLYRTIAWQIKRLWPGEKWVRVTDDKERRGYRFVALNRKVSRAERLSELLRERVPLNQAMYMLDLQPVFADELMGNAQELATQQVQQGAAMLQQQTGQQMPPETMQPLIEQATLRILMQSQEMQVVFKQNHIGDIPVDIKIDVQPESLVMQHEEFEKLAELAGTGQIPIPPEALIRASTLRNKKEIIATLTPPPDPMQQQMAMLRLAELQAQVEKLRAEAQDEQASAQERMANAKFKIESQSMKTQAQAMESAAKAGSMTVPDEGET